MKLMPTCRDITRRVLEGEERRLGSTERLVIRAHWLICKGCSNFGRQVELMRKATARWRSYAED